MKKEIIHENQIRFILSAEDLHRQKMLPTGDLNDLIVRPDGLPRMIRSLGIEMVQVGEIEAAVIDGGLVIELKLIGESSQIKRAYYSSDINNFYAFLAQERVDGKLLYKNGSYILIPYKEVSVALAEEYYLKPAVTEEPLQNCKVISNHALHDLIKN